MASDQLSGTTVVVPVDWVPDLAGPGISLRRKGISQHSGHRHKQTDDSKQTHPRHPFALPCTALLIFSTTVTWTWVVSSDSRSCHFKHPAEHGLI